MNYQALYDSLRVSLGLLKQSQVDGINIIVPVCQTAKLSIQHTAYVLATAYHETASTLSPIEEYGKGKGHPYAPYYGRGYVQLTWDRNYKSVGQKIGVDLYSNPELALKPSIASKILVLGMKEGWFTGKKLSDYQDYVSMRHIVNGTDKAALIAKYAYWFEAALKASGYTPNTVNPISKEETKMNTQFGNILGGIVRAWAPGIVTLLVSKHILPPGDYSDIIAVLVSLLTSVWSIKTNLTDNKAA